MVLPMSDVVASMSSSTSSNVGWRILRHRQQGQHDRAGTRLGRNPARKRWSILTPARDHPPARPRRRHRLRPGDGGLRPLLLLPRRELRGVLRRRPPLGRVGGRRRRGGHQHRRRQLDGLGGHGLPRRLLGHVVRHAAGAGVHPLRLRRRPQDPSAARDDARRVPGDALPVVAAADLGSGARAGDVRHPAGADRRRRLGAHRAHRDGLHHVLPARRLDAHRLLGARRHAVGDLRRRLPVGADARRLPDRRADFHQRLGRAGARARRRPRDARVVVERRHRQLEPADHCRVADHGGDGAVRQPGVVPADPRLEVGGGVAPRVHPRRGDGRRRSAC